MKKIFAFSLILISALAFAQDPAFTLPYSAPLNLNPALAGSNGSGRFATLFREQWPKMDAVFRTSYTSYDHMINKINSGIGAYYMYDMTNYVKTDIIAAAYSYCIQFAEDKVKLSPGIDFGYVMKKIDTAAMEMTDPEIFDKVKISYPDLGFGLQLTSSRINFGLSAKHLLSPDQSFDDSLVSKLPIRYSGLFDYTFGEISEHKKWKFNGGAYFMSQGSYTHIAGTFVACWRKLRLGLGYSSANAFIVKAAWEGNILRLRYSYDFYTSALYNSAGGAHEVTTLFNLFKKKKKEEFMEMNNYHF